MSWDYFQITALASMIIGGISLVILIFLGIAARHGLKQFYIYFIAAIAIISLSTTLSSIELSQLGEGAIYKDSIFIGEQSLMSVHISGFYSIVTIRRQHITGHPCQRPRNHELVVMLLCAILVITFILIRKHVENGSNDNIILFITIYTTQVLLFMCLIWMVIKRLNYWIRVDESSFKHKFGYMRKILVVYAILVFLVYVGMLTVILFGISHDFVILIDTLVMIMGVMLIATSGIVQRIREMVKSVTSLSPSANSAADITMGENTDTNKLKATTSANEPLKNEPNINDDPKKGKETVTLQEA